MISEYLDLIETRASSVSSEEILDCVKVASVLRYGAAGALGLGAGYLGHRLKSENEAAQSKTDGDAKALLAGLAGSGLGYYLASRNKAPSVQQYEYQSSPDELTVEDIYG